MARGSNSRRLDETYPRLITPTLSITGSPNTEPNGSGVSFEEGAMKIEHADGSVTIDFDSQGSEPDPSEKGFNENLSVGMHQDKLAEIASGILDGIDRDEQSRKEWLSTRELGIALLGLKLEKPRSDAGLSSAPLEGMSTVRNPLLLEATVNFQATARAELLPAAGPVKVRNDTPPPPVNQDTNAAQQLADSMETNDELSQALEKDMNHYLTSTASEYIPDTDRMLFYIGFGGDGFKKVYNCPLRRRPVSESIDAEDLIVSNAATDLQSCGRVSHHIKMRQSTMRRMQLIGAYRDVELMKPPAPEQNPVDKKKEEIAGIRSTYQRPEDRDYDVYEVYCELDLNEYAPTEYKNKGLPLPYRVTVEKGSRQILDLRRNWKEDDEQCMAKQFFVQFPFIRGLGFYGLGFIHILGNTTNALTAAWRECLDAGMFSNFPGGLIAKGASRQNSNNMRVAPGALHPIDVGAQDDIRKAIMPLPYKDPSGAFISFIQHINETGRRLAATANIGVGEGKQDAPVGTTLALIEQASKVIDSAHKRLHAAQAEEFRLLKERFRDDPESFWRHNRKPAKQWKKDQFVEALNKCELVPVADPNNPTSLHRIAKALAILQLSQSAQDLYDPTAVHMRVLRTADIDPTGLFRATPAPAPPDPRMIAIQQKAAAVEKQTQIQLLETKIKAAETQAKIADKAKEREAKERLAQLQIQLQQLKIEQEKIIHAHEVAQGQAAAQQEMQIKHATKQQELQHANLDKQQELQHSAIQAVHEMRGGLVQTHHDLAVERAKHAAQMARDREKHELELEHAKELHAIKLESAKEEAKIKAEQAKKIAAAKPKPAAKKT